MDFEHWEKVRALQARVEAFMVEHIHPNEEGRFAKVNEGDRWQPVPYKKSANSALHPMCWRLIDPSQPILCFEGAKCRLWTRSPRRSSGSAKHSRASMRSATSSPASSPNWRRPSVCSRATAKERNKKDALRQEPDDGDTGGRSSAAKRASAHYDRKTSWRQTEPKPKRSGPCPGNRQDAAGNHRRMQRCSPEPCRSGDCAAQARWPH
jgi:hypothetical protein